MEGLFGKVPTQHILENRWKARTSTDSGKPTKVYSKLQFQLHKIFLSANGKTHNATRGILFIKRIRMTKF